MAAEITPTGSEVPDGSLLSCYTASIAEILYRCGGDWRGVIGLSSTFAVRPTGDRFAFVHHEPHLRQAVAGLRRCGSDRSGELRNGLREELARTGAVIAVGDVYHLPWSTGYRRRHAPHWFVFDRWRPGGWHVTDRFQARDEHGEQAPWAGWVADADLPGLLTRGELEPEQVLRERLAFGDEEPEPVSRHRFQWLATPPGRGAASGAAAGRSGAAGSSGAPPVPRPLSQPGWLRGAAAVAALRDHLRERGSDPAGYRQLDDLWVAARHRRLRCSALARRLPAGDPKLAAAAELATAWAAVPMAAEFAREGARRGRDRTSPLLTALAAVAAAEAADARLGPVPEPTGPARPRAQRIGKEQRA